MMNPIADPTAPLPCLKLDIPALRPPVLLLRGRV